MTGGKPVAAVLAIVLLVSNIGSAEAREWPDQPAASPVVVKMVKRSANNGGGWVKLFMRDKRIVSGRVMEARPDEFDLALDENGMRETFRYVDVKDAKGPPTRPLIKLGVAAGAIVGGWLIFHYGLQPKT